MHVHLIIKETDNKNNIVRRQHLRHNIVRRGIRLFYVYGIAREVVLFAANVDAYYMDSRED